MSAVARFARAHRAELAASRRRNQFGYTLLEVLLVVAISGLILGPLFAWMILTMRQQPVQRDGMIVSAQAGLLRGHFPRDVTVAGAARAYPADFPATQPAAEPNTDWDVWYQGCEGNTATSRPGVRHLAVLISQGESRIKTIYSVAPMRAGTAVVPNRSSIWRTQCGANTGIPISQTQVVDDIDATPAATFATCAVNPAAPAPATPAGVCRQVRIQVTQRDSEGDSKRPVVLNATRRTDLASLDVSPTGNYLPTARYRIVSEEYVGLGSPARRVVFSGDVSNDAEDGTNLTYEWDVPNQTDPNGPRELVQGLDITRVFPAAGSYWVRLTVTDSGGGIGQYYGEVIVENRVPIANMTVSPTAVIAGQDLTLSSAGSSDPDGQPLTYRWTLTSGTVADSGQVAERTGANETFTVPEWAFGTIIVALTVTDPLGGSNTTSQSVEVIDPTTPVDPDPTDPGEEPEPGAPVATFVASRTSGTTFAFDATESDGSNLSYAWDFGLLAGPGPTTGATVEHTYPNAGTYLATLTITDDQARTSRHSLEIVVPGTPTAPTNLRVENGVLYWDARPGARRYLLDLEASNNGCAQSVLNRPVPRSAAPRAALPPSPCTGAGTTARARVGVEAAVGVVAWSDWIDVPVVVK